MMSYPNVRLRRLRENPTLRLMLKESRLSSKDLVQPLFVKESLARPIPIASMPGQQQHSLASLIEEARRVTDHGVPAVILFGIPSKKDLMAKAAYSPAGIIQKSVTAIKKAIPNLLVITDVCLCEYHSHGHCGHIRRNSIDNDSSVKTIARVALSHARAGADIVAPSDMMDGRVGKIRQALDKAGFSHLPIISYAVKYASAFYSPFREAAESAPSFGDRHSYQMDFRNRRESIREAELDLREGADIVMVKPALSYLDIIRDLRERIHAPIAAYSVSGEYAMIKAAAAKGWADEQKMVAETHLAMKRAGAQILFTYWATDIARWLRKNKDLL